jgi:hypothetical protein
MRRALLLLVLGGVPATPGAAQRAAPVVAGTRVRLDVPALGARLVIGSVLAAEADTIVLAPDGEGAGLIVPLAGVRRLEVGHRRTHAVEGAVVGLLAGIVAGAVAQPCEDDPETGEPCSLGDLALSIPYALVPEVESRMTILALAGMIAGGILGGNVTTERWRPVALDGLLLGVAPAGGNGVAVGLRFSF